MAMVRCRFGECQTNATREIGGEGFCDRHASLMHRNGQHIKAVGPMKALHEASQGSDEDAQGFLAALHVAANQERAAASTVKTNDYDQILATFSDGSQVLVWLWNDGHIEVAKRIGKDATWGPPARGERL